MKEEKLKSSRVQNSKVESFEDLNVYAQARELTNKIYTVTRQGFFSKDYGLVDQIRRASISIMSNIAEGFERGTNAQFIHFLFISKGSCGEVRAQLTIAFDQKYISEKTCKNLFNKCRLISGMLSNLISYLKTSRYRGIKYKKTSTKTMKAEMNEMSQQIKNKKDKK